MSLSLYPRLLPATQDLPLDASQDLPQPGKRDAGLDALRGLAALLVVYLHAAVAYLVQPMPGLVWPTADAASPLVSQLFWLIELFVMPLFLLLSGFFACRSLLRSGAASFLRSRGNRLLRPLLFGVIVLLPINYGLWLLGWVAEGRVSADSLSTLKVPRESRVHLYGLAHLWYLQYLLLYCVALAGSLAWFSRRGANPAGDTAASHRPDLARYSRAVVVSLVLMTVGVVAVAPEVVWGFQHAALPFLTKWVYCGTFFLGGVLLAVLDRDLQWLSSRAGRLLACGGVCALAALPLGQWAVAHHHAVGDQHADQQALLFPISLTARLTLAMLTAAAAWGLAAGLVGSATRLGGWVGSRPPLAATVGYLAAASFWIYLVHHPLVALTQIHLKLAWPGLSGGAKSLLTLAIATGVSLISYHGLIRGRRLGVWLGFESATVRPAVVQPAVSPTVEEAVEVRPAARRAA